MSNKAMFSAADQLDRLSRLLEGVVEARDAFRTIGPLDQAISERKALIASLGDEVKKLESAALKERSCAKDMSDEAKALVAKAKRDAADMKEAANEKAKQILDAAEESIAAKEKASALRLSNLEKQSQIKLADLDSQAKRMQEILAQRSDEAKSAEARTDAAKEKLAGARAAIAELMKDE